MASCSSKKAATETSAPPINKESREEQMLKDGYIKASVKDNTKSECGFVLTKDPTGEVFLPINLEDSLKQDGIKIWLKYRPIKPVQATCIVGMPISIEDIELIEQ